VTCLPLHPWPGRLLPSLPFFPSWIDYGRRYWACASNGPSRNPNRFPSFFFFPEEVVIRSKTDLSLFLPSLLFFFFSSPKEERAASKSPRSCFFPSLPPPLPRRGESSSLVRRASAPSPSFPFSGVVGGREWVLFPLFPFWRRENHARAASLAAIAFSFSLSPEARE